jgi:hypothetical protein
MSAVTRHNQEMALQRALHLLAMAEPHELDALILSLDLRAFFPPLEPEDKAVLTSSIASAVSRCWVKRSQGPDYPTNGTAATAISPRQTSAGT